MGCRRGRAEELGIRASTIGQPIERRVRLTAGRGVVLCTLVLLNAGCGKNPPAATSDSDTELVIGFPEGNLESADVGPNQFTKMLSVEGLTWGNVDGRAIPRLAASWAWAPDGRQLRLQLRPNVYFHDGTKLTAVVAAEILKNYMARPSATSSYSSLSDVTGVYPAGELEVVIELSQPSAFLIDDLDLPLAISGDIGTGPFRVVKKESSQVFFESFDRYYQGAPAIKRIHVKMFDALRTAWSSLLRAEVDMVTDVPAEAVEFVPLDQVDVLRYKRRYQYMLGFNLRRPPFTSPMVRRALNFAVDRSALIQRALRGYGTEATGPLWPRHWAYDTSITPFTFDPAQAMSLLESAGLSQGRAGATSHVPNARFKLTCLIPEDFSLYERLGLELQKQLYDVGVDMQFEVVPFDDYYDRIVDGQFEAVLVDLISGPSFARPYIFWRSAATFQGSNVFGYENAEAEDLFERLRASALNETASRSATNRLQRVLLEDPPALFLAWSERARVVGPRFEPAIDPERDPILTIGRWKPNPTQVALGK